MNTFKSLLLISAMSFTVIVSSCSKKDPEPEFSEAIQNIIPESVIDDLRSKGMQLNSGKTPPNIEGIYIVNPLKLLTPYGPEDNWQTGKIIADMTYRFYNQTADQKITYDSKSGGGTASSIGKGALIAGNGTEFTIFSEEFETHSNGITATMVAVISGEMTAQGIKNLQYAFLLTSKTGDDNDSYLMPVNKSRIWYDGNQIADRGTAFRLAIEANQTSQTPIETPASIEKN